MPWPMAAMRRMLTQYVRVSQAAGPTPSIVSTVAPRKSTAVELWLYWRGGTLLWRIADLLPFVTGKSARQP